MNYYEDTHRNSGAIVKGTVGMYSFSTVTDLKDVTFMVDSANYRFGKSSVARIPGYTQQDASFTDRFLLARVNSAGKHEFVLSFSTS